MRVYIDFETRSECDIRKAGAWVYSKHPSTSILCMAWAIDDGVTDIKTYFDTDCFLEDAIASGAMFVAHNAGFEQAMWQNVLVERFGWPPIPISQWVCTAAKARTYALPANLEGAAMALGLVVQKDMEGNRLMKRLSKPKAPSKKDPSIWDNDPEKFKKLYAYCMTDVEATRLLDKKLPDLSDFERLIWEEDQRINKNGVRIDEDLVRSAIWLNIIYENELNAKLATLTKGKLESATKIMGMKEYLGIDGSLDKAAIEALLANPDLDPNFRSVIEIRQALSKSSIKKYHRIIDMLEGGRVRDIMVYHAASTGRWGGAGIQVQNFPRGNMDIYEGHIGLIKEQVPEVFSLLDVPMNDCLSSALRGAILPSEGKEFVVADYAQIESRVLFWLAEDKVGLDKWIAGVDLYVDMAKVVYKDDSLTKKSKKERQLGKALILGAGYGLGHNKFKESVALPPYNIDISEELARDAIKAYRTEYCATVAFWYALENSAKATIMTGKTTVVNKIKFGMRAGFLMIQLPSGRMLALANPKVEKLQVTPEQVAVLVANKMLWKLDKAQIVYDGIGINKQWCRQHTYAGGLAQWVTQATARDVMAHAMAKLINHPIYTTVMSVHDELVTEAPIGKGSAKELEDLICDLPLWAEGLPVAAEGWVGNRYRK